MVDPITRVLLAVTKHLPLPHKVKWKVGMRDEVSFWNGHMAKHYRPDSSGAYVGEALFRLDKNAPLQQQFVDLVAHCPADPIRILDVGSGPFSCLGKTIPGRTVELTAVDPLADTYAELHRKHKITPAVVPQRCDGEQLSALFAPNTFDLAHANNCLDHSYDPVKAIQEMFALVKPGCCVYLRHEVNVAENADYVGMHQWNFRPEGKEFWISDKNRAVNVSMDELFAGKADLQLTIVGKMMINIIRKR